MRATDLNLFNPLFGFLVNNMFPQKWVYFFGVFVGRGGLLVGLGFVLSGGTGVFASESSGGESFGGRTEVRVGAMKIDKVAVGVGVSIELTGSRGISTIR